MKDKLIRPIFTPRFFYAGAGVVLFFALSFVWAPLLYLALVALAVFLVVTAVDGWQLYRNTRVLGAFREVPQILSMGDPNMVHLNLWMEASETLSLEVIDELPYQLQERHFRMATPLVPGEKVKLGYEITPTKRGEYHFGHIHLFLKSSLGFVVRQMTCGEPQKVSVYPSIIQARKYELLALSKVSDMQGLKKIRRLGHNYEFDQIKEYVPGDDPRSINWKASGRAASLMVNHYEDERSQPIYSIIDKGRLMKMAFNGMTFLDYAVNSALTISKVALKKHDRAGLITFSDHLGTFLKASGEPRQINRILEALYNEKERFYESDFELLYNAISRMVRGRSLLFLYTNFISIHSLERILPILRKINRKHLLVVVSFEDSEMEAFSQRECQEVRDIYSRTVARQFLLEKQQIVQELKRHGIQCITCRPEELTIKTLNKYLELKARGLI